MQTKNSIDVIVRVCPYNKHELQDNSKTPIKIINDKTLIFDPKEQETYPPFHNLAQRCRNLLMKQNKQLQFTFDKIFNLTSTNNDVFEGSIKGLITKLLDGRNCSIFAYGATGKTHTMQNLKETFGPMYYIVKELFTEIGKRDKHHEFHLSASALEVYNETVKDLYYESEYKLKLREDGRHKLVITELKKYTIYNALGLLIWLTKVNRNRTRHTIDGYGKSTRSHAIFRVYIKIINKLNNKTRQVKLSMIDLAGFQKVPATGCKDVRFVESININKSLMALDNCINSLTRGKKYIPYRNSKLTRLLKDSFDNMCHIIMIANISPSSLSYIDTYRTLKYANLAKKIKYVQKDASQVIYW